MAVGSERGTTNLDVLYADQIFCGGTFTGSVQNTGTESSASEVLTSISCPGTITGSVINYTTANSIGTTTGTKAVFTNLDVKGTIIGSKMSVGTLSYDVTGDLDVTGTVTGTYLVGSYLNASSYTGSTAAVKGTITGSVANFTTVGLLGTLSGGVVNGTIMNAAQYVGSRADVKGTVSGSFIVGTVAATAFTGSSITTAGMLSSKGTIQVGATPGTYAHGLGAAPSFISIVPINALQGATGTEGNQCFMPAAADATAVYVQAGTTGSAWVYCIA